MMTITRTAIVQEARTWLNTPYKHQACIKGVAVDCAHLVIGVARNVGIVARDFDIANYSRQPDGHSLIAHAERWMYRISSADALQPGDMIVLAYDQDPNHVGLIADYYHGGLRSIIHALHDRGVVEHRLDPSTLKRFVAGYRFPGVEA